MTKPVITMCLLPILLCFVSPPVAADGRTPVAAALQALESVHALNEVAISPDGRRVIYGSQVTGTRGGSTVDVSALFLADGRDGSHVQRLTACPGAVCDEHSLAWSPDGTQVAFVTTDATEQPQLAVAAANGTGVHVITSAHRALGYAAMVAGRQAARVPVLQRCAEGARATPSAATRCGGADLDRLRTAARNHRRQRR